VGEMPEQDDDYYEVVKRKDGTYLVDAQIPFYNFLSYFYKAEWMSEVEQEFDTLAGFILHQLERIPHIGDTMEWKGFQFEIIDMDAQRIDKVLVTASEEILEDMEDGPEEDEV
jgi:putative hemolysin